MGCKEAGREQNWFILSFYVAAFRIKKPFARLWRADVDFVAGGVENRL